ncbi:hypothetical protein P5V15_007024 [Pogonomyrmex californicus]
MELIYNYQRNYINIREYVQIKYSLQLYLSFILIKKAALSRQLNGIWHTAIVAYGREYFFGPAGIQSVRPMVPVVPYPILHPSGFFPPREPGMYSIFKHNCNSFTEEVSNFLVGKDIPKFILDLPGEILQTPIGQALGPLIETLSNNLSKQEFREKPEYQLLNTAIEEARLNSIALEERRNVINEKLAKKERKKKKKKKKKEKKEKDSKEVTGSDSNNTGSSNCCADMTENESAIDETQQQASDGENAEMLPSERVMQMEEDEKHLIDVQAEYDGLVDALKEKLNDEEQTCLDELRQYVLENEGSWALGDNFVLLYDKSLGSDVRVKLLNVLSVAALKDDLANMFENLSSSEWLLYISEWQHQDQNISSNINNIRMTIKVAVHSLLSNSEDLQIRGVAIIHNLVCKEVKSLYSVTVVFDDVAVELTMALPQYFNGTSAKEQLYTCMKSLAHTSATKRRPQLIQMIGPEPNKFRETSQRICRRADRSS